MSSCQINAGSHGPDRWTVSILASSLAGTLGSLYLSLGMKLKACPLCFYQRTFIMVVAAIAVTSFLIDRRSMRVSLLSLPMVVAGLGVAAFHNFLVWTGKLECPEAVGGWGDAPMQSFAIFLLLLGLCLGGAWTTHSAGICWKKSVVGALCSLGLLMAVACVVSSPPLPPSPEQPYDPVKQPLDTCRPPFQMR